MKITTTLLTVCLGLATFFSSCKTKVSSCISSSSSSGLYRIEDTLRFEHCDLYLNDVSRLWDFGDGTTASEREVKHIYSSPGTYEVKLTITGKSNSDTKSVIVTIISATNQDYVGNYNVGQYCLCDSTWSCYNDTATYVSTVTTTGADGIVIHNFYNIGADENAIVDRNKLSIPPQSLGADSIAGIGSFNAAHNQFSLLISKKIAASTYKSCFLTYTRQ